MDYITRDLQHKTKEILDRARVAPVRIRRGSEFFEITKLNFYDVHTETENNKPLAEPTVIPDDQEYQAPNPYSAANMVRKRTLDDLMNDGTIQRGIK